MNWVSILDQNRLAATLELPPEVYPVAYLCLGYVREFLAQPELEMAGWRNRLPLHELIHANRWGQRLGDGPLKTFLQTPERHTSRDEGK